MEIERLRINVKTIKRCPKCESVFVTDQECESCGLQLKKNRISEELSRGSFYSLKETYNKEINFFYSNFPSLISNKNETFKTYRFDLAKRFNLLVKYFVSDEKKGKIDSKQFLFEFKDLVEEMINQKYEVNYFYDKIENLDDHPFRQELFMALNEVVSLKQASESKFLDRRFMNLMSYSFILKTFFIYGAIILFSIELFKRIYLN